VAAQRLPDSRQLSSTRARAALLFDADQRALWSDSEFSRHVSALSDKIKTYLDKRARKNCRPSLKATRALPFAPDFVHSSRLWSRAAMTTRRRLKGTICGAIGQTLDFCRSAVKGDECFFMRSNASCKRALSLQSDMRRSLRHWSVCGARRNHNGRGLRMSVQKIGESAFGAATLECPLSGGTVS